MDVQFLESKRAASAWSVLFQRALPLCNDVEEAALCADMAFESISKLPDGINLSTTDVPEEVNEPETDASFSYDIHNRRAQGVLNKALKAAKKLSANAKKDLELALKRDKNGSSEAIVKFINKYRVQLAKLLTTTQLASVLEGAREVAKDIPTLAVFHGAVPPPPSLEPKEAVELIDRLSRFKGEEQWRAIYELPTNQQHYVQQALAVKEAGGPVVPPKFTPPAPPEGAPEGIHFPVIDEAVKQLAEKNVMTRERFDALDTAARAKSFAVAGVDAEETLTKVRDVLAENVKKGADYETFRKEVLSAVDEGTFMSDAHMETVFRTNVQSAFSDGQMTVLQHPLVRSGFPYSFYNAIHDERVRENHLALEKLGIQGTNIYRTDDPVFQTFRPPWDYNDRCGWTPMTVRFAAEKGIKEAQEWLETGVEPVDKAFVSMPDFAPPEGFRRSVSSAPLSVQLSMQSISAFGPSIVPDDYPRDKSNRFVDKLIIAEAAREQGKASELRESLPDDQRWKLDRMISVLRAGGTIHHPKESPGLAVDVNGTVANSVWANYAHDLDMYERWTEREQARSEWKRDVEKFTKTLRDESLTTTYKRIAATNDVESITEVRAAINGVLKKHYDHLDDLDEQFECIGATEQEVRDVARLRHTVGLDVTNLAEKYVLLKKTSGNEEVVAGCFNELLDTLHSALKKINLAYEEIVERAYQRIDDETKHDPEPPEPKEPEEGEYSSDPILAIGQPAGGKALNEVVHRFAHFRSKYSDTVILNVKTGLQNKTNTVQQVVLPAGTMMTVVGEDREPDGTRIIVAQVSKWGGGGPAMSVDDGEQPQKDERAERINLIADILFALFGKSAIDVAKELFQKQDEGISAAFADGTTANPKVKRRYGRKPGPGWRAGGITAHGVQIWIWGPNTKTPAPQEGPQPTPLNPSPQQAPVNNAGLQQVPAPPTPPPAQPQANQFRIGGQRARFQSQQAYQLAMAKLNGGQQLTQTDKLSLTTKLTNMSVLMLRSLHTALYNQLNQTNVAVSSLTRQEHVNAIKNILSQQSINQPPAQEQPTPQATVTSPPPVVTPEPPLPQPVVAPEPEKPSVPPQQSSQHSPYYEMIDKWFSSWPNTGLSQSKKEQIGTALKKTVSQMSVKALDIMFTKLRSNTILYESVDDVTKAFNKLRPRQRKKSTVYGFYEVNMLSGKGILHLDYSDTGVESDAMWTHAHEMYHAIDGADTFSGSAEWKKVYKKEIRRNRALPEKDHPLTRYASRNSSEGFAEFGAALVADAAAAKKDFPECYAFCQKHGLVEGGDNQEVQPQEQPRNVPWGKTTRQVRAHIRDTHPDFAKTADEMSHEQLEEAQKHIAELLVAKNPVQLPIPLVTPEPPPLPQKKGAAPVSTESSAEADSGASKVRDFISSIGANTTDGHVNKLLDDLAGSVPTDKFNDLLSKLGIAGKVGSRKAALDKIKQVISHQMEAYQRANQGTLSAPDSPEMTAALQEAEVLNKHLGSMDIAKAEQIHAATDKAESEMGTSDFLKWATTLLGFKQKGSKKAVAREVKSFVDRLATSAAQTGF